MFCETSPLPQLSFEDDCGLWESEIGGGQSHDVNITSWEASRTFDLGIAPHNTTKASIAGKKQHRLLPVYD